MQVKLKSLNAVLIDASTLSGIDAFDIKCWRVEYSVYIQMSKFEGRLDMEALKSTSEIIDYIRELYTPIENKLRDDLVKSSTRII